MRTLKLQMQMTIDGFVAGPEGQLDWMSFDNDPKMWNRINQITDSSDTIIMGRKMSAEFCKYWESVPKESQEYSFAQKMVNIPKIVFSKTEKNSPGKNARMENGDLKTEVNKLKSLPGKDIIVYGGAGFVSSLIKENLIDDYYFFVNPVAIVRGLTIFNDRLKLKLVDSVKYGAEVVNHYKPL
jgi:dihydrofolate reductase